MHRLGGVGLAAFERHEQSKKSFAELSSALSQTQVDHLHYQLNQFRNALAKFAANHREDIKSDGEFRHAFERMCSSIGVDPLAGPRKGGWWTEMLGLSDWQYELGVQIVDVCVSTRHRNGGMIPMAELIRLVTKLRGMAAGAITEADVVRSIKTLHPLGAGYQIIELGARKLVRSVVKELDGDQAAIVATAQDTNGRVVVDMLVAGPLRWSLERAQAALDNMLLIDGMCWMDEQDDEAAISYWIPSAMEWEWDDSEDD